MPGLSVLRVVDNATLDRQEAARLEAEASAERQNQPLMIGLAAYLNRCWDAAQMAKDPIESIMLKAKRQRQGVYESDKLAAISAQGGSAVFMPLTEVKCRSAEAWIRDILLDGGDPPWILEPSPIPELSPAQREECAAIASDKMIELAMATGQAPTREQIAQIKAIVEQHYRFSELQIAQDKADRMADKIKDQFAEGGWYQAFDDFVTDLVTYPAAFLKGPVLRKRAKLGWKQNSGRTEIETTEELVPEYERVDPFRIYPEPGVENINDGYMFHHHPLTRSDLAALIGVPNYDSGAIQGLLDNPTQATAFFTDIEMTKNQLERKFHAWNAPTATYNALEFWGKVSGKMLLEWGMSEADVPDPAKEYDANVWMIGGVIIKAVLNYDPLGEKPYAKASFFKVPGAFWGMGIPERISDVQDVCNAAVRALVNNMGIASGPQVEVNIERTPPNEPITQLRPWKIWQVLNDPLGSTAPAVRFDQPDDRSGQLMAVYEKFSALADDHSGIPAYVSGDISVTGAGRTSSGLSMLMGAAGKGIRQVVSNIDNYVIKVIVQRQFVFNMRYEEDESIKGDLVVVPRGAVNLAVKETVNVRRVEFLNATANPVDMAIIGVEGRASVLREVAKGLQMPSEEVVPTRDKLNFEAVMQAMQQMPGSGPGQQAAPQALDPSGAPKGGAAGNVVSNKQTGAAA